MAKRFSKDFYNSGVWQDARDAYVKDRIAIDAGACELCGLEPGTEVHHKIFLTPDNIDDPEISLNPENFELLCYRCHRLRHEAARRVAWMADRQRRMKSSCTGTYYVDDDGSVHPFQAFLVWGAPGSGKSTYVREHMQPGDLVIDMDAIGYALSLANRQDIPAGIEKLTYDVRDMLLDKIAKREVMARAAWVIASAPNSAKRQSLAQHLGAETVFVPADWRTCYQRALADNTRQDKAWQLAIIDRWFRDYQPD